MDDIPESTQAHTKSEAIDRTAYPFRSRWLDLPAGRMHYVDEGAAEGDILLFVHGTPTWSFEWRHLIRELRSSRRCIALDLLGFGLSDRPPGFPYTPEAHAEAVAGFVQQLGLDRFILVVHDYGGPIGLPLCLRWPERVTRLVLFNTWMWSFTGDRDMESKGRFAGSRLGGFLYRRANFSLRVLVPQSYGDRRKLTPAIHRQYLDRFPDPESRGRVLWALAKALLGSSRYYDSLWAQREKLRGRPALILWGMRDVAFRPYQLERWKQVLPEARVVELADAGHWPHEEEPERVADELRHFLAQPGAGQAGENRSSQPARPEPGHPSPEGF
jgi:haloalkane dehalogenase